MTPRAASRARVRALALAALLAPACREATPPPAPTTAFDGGPAVLGLPELFAAGEERALEHLGTDPLAAAVPRVEGAVLRVRVHEPEQPGGGLVVHHGSGVLVAGGTHALTVAHVAETGGAESWIEVVLPDGRSTRALLAASSERFDGADLALLRLVEPLEDAAWVPLAPGGEPTPASDGGEVVLLGYPARLGRDPDGAIVPDRPGETMSLRPLRLVCAMATPDSSGLVPVAGAIPVGGMSGAPVVDGAGRLVAVQRAVSELLEDGRPAVRIDVVPLAPLLGELAAVGIAPK